MTKQRTLLAILLVGVFSLFVTNFALAAGIMGPQAGDRTPEDNDGWLKKVVELIRMANKEAKAGNGEKSMEHGKVGMELMKEINSEGWAPTIERSAISVRYGIRAAKKGKLEKASLEYEDALKKLEALKYGDLNWTHDSFLGIGDRK